MDSHLDSQIQFQMSHWWNHLLVGVGPSQPSNDAMRDVNRFSLGWKFYISFKSTIVRTITTVQLPMLLIITHSMQNAQVVIITTLHL